MAAQLLGVKLDELSVAGVRRFAVQVAPRVATAARQAASQAAGQVAMESKDAFADVPRFLTLTARLARRRKKPGPGSRPGRRWRSGGSGR